MMSIGEVAALCGIRASAIRYYERLGILPAAERKSGRRVYDDRIVDRLTVIRFARESGFTVREVRRLFDGRPYSASLRKLAQAKVVELDTVIERAKTMQGLLKEAVRCNCVSLEKCGRRLRRASRDYSLGARIR
jgi:MerR family transcriptional regulator, redox-sensitive transcriptional activator SoxR